MNQVLVVHPPLTVARDFIDYPYLTNLGALQVGATLRQAMEDGGGSVRIVDSFCLPGSGLAWRDDGRAHVGASVDEVVEQCLRADEGEDAPQWSHIVVAYAPFHRPPHRDDVLAGVLEALRGAQLEMLKRNRIENEGEALPSTWGAFVLDGAWE